MPTERPKYDPGASGKPDRRSTAIKPYAKAPAAWRCWPRFAYPLMEKPEDPLSNVDPPASMSRNEVESCWGKCEADTIRGHLATLILRLAGR